MGIDSINRVPGEIRLTGYNTVFLITGRHFQQENDLDFLDGLPVTHFIKNGINVDEEEMESVFRQYSANKNQAIVAIGGGSVIDLAKAIIFRCIDASLPVPFFIAIPTTAGSGSEATHFAVVYRNNKKHSLVNDKLLPAVAILDPRLGYSLPPYQTAVSGMDVLAQAVESYWNINATAESKHYAAECINIWKEYFLDSVNKPDAINREKMLWAAHLAGKAINITRTTGPHALSYYLTKHYNVPHGQAVALFLPLFFIYNNAGADLCSLLKVKKPVEAMEYTRKTMANAGLATHLSALGLQKESIVPALLDEVNDERFVNNPVPFDRDKLQQLFNQYL